MLGRVSSTDPIDLGPNAWMADEMRTQWEADPTSVDPAWRALFEGEAANGNGTPDIGIYGFAGNFKNQVAVYDPIGSGRLRTFFYPNLLATP